MPPKTVRVAGFTWAQWLRIEAVLQLRPLPREWFFEDEDTPTGEWRARSL